MKFLGKYILGIALALLLGTQAMTAQTMRLHMKSGETLEYNCADVDSLTFIPAEKPSPKFQLAVSDIGIASATLSVTPDDNAVRYYYDVCTREQYDALSGGVEEIVTSYIEYLKGRYPTLTMEQILGNTLSQGADSDQLTGLPAGTEFVFYAIAVDDEGKCYGKAATTTFSTLPGGDPADCTFTVGYENLTSDALTVLVTPSDPSVRYWMGIVAVANFSGDYALTAQVQQEVADYATSTGMNMAELVQKVTFAGDIALEESGLTPETPYYIYVYAMNPDGSAAGAVTKKRFVTQTELPSDAAVSLSYRYFDGDALYEADPETYAGYQGKVLVQTRLTPNETATSWAIALAKGDLTDETLYPDEETKRAVLQAGSINVESKTFVADWTTCTFLYFAADADGIDGVLKRLLVTFDKANARPVSEIGIEALPARLAAPAAALPAPQQSAITLRLKQAKEFSSKRTYRH